MSSEEVDGVAGDLLEKYWFLDSFGADLGERGCGCLQFVDDFWR